MLQEFWEVDSSYGHHNAVLEHKNSSYNFLFPVLTSYKSENSLEQFFWNLSYIRRPFYAWRDLSNAVWKH